jgi:hypothetical protein
MRRNAGILILDTSKAGDGLARRSVTEATSDTGSVYSHRLGHPCWCRSARLDCGGFGGTARWLWTLAEYKKITHQQVSLLLRRLGVVDVQAGWGSKGHGSLNVEVK